MKNSQISIVIPCYNEESNLKRGVLEQVAGFLNKQHFTWEVIIANDQSIDHSLKLINSFVKKHHGFRLLDLPHGGKPSAVWGGIKAAKYPWVFFTDMDQSTPIQEMNKLIPFFGRYDFVIGSRGSTRQGASIIRKIMAKTFLTFRKLFLLSNISDTQCGFKAIKTNLARKLFPRLGYFHQQDNKGWRVSAFDVELLFMAQKAGYKTKEVLVNWKNEDISTTKGDDLKRFKKESRQMIQEIWRVKVNDLKGLYNDLQA